MPVDELTAAHADNKTLRKELAEANRIIDSAGMRAYVNEHENEALRKELAAKERELEGQVLLFRDAVARIAELEGKQVTQLERAAQEVARQRNMLKWDALWDALGDFDREACTENARRILDAAFPNPRSQG